MSGDVGGIQSRAPGQLGNQKKRRPVYRFDEENAFSISQYTALKMKIAKRGLHDIIASPQGPTWSSVALETGSQINVQCCRKCSVYIETTSGRGGGQYFKLAVGRVGGGGSMIKFLFWPKN